MNINRQAFLQSIESGKLESVYLFTGSEEWTKQEALQRLRDKLLMPGLEALNDTVMEGVTARQIFDVAETLPMMCERRIVVVRDWAPLMTGKSADEENEVKKLEGWLQSPPDTCVLIFYMRGKPNGTKSASKVMAKYVTEVAFDALTGAELTRWMQQQLKPAGKKIDGEACGVLTFMAGSELTRLSIELDKLVSYVGDRPVITAEDIRAIVSASLDYQIFELSDRLLEGNIGEAQKMVGALMQGGENVRGIIGTLSHQFRRSAHMRYALDSGKTYQQMAKILDMKDYAAKMTARQCKARPAEVFQRLYQLCADTVYDINRGRARDDFALNALLFKISAQKSVPVGNK